MIQMILNIERILFVAVLLPFSDVVANREFVLLWIHTAYLEFTIKKWFI